jgi:hypothetical protein
VLDFFKENSENRLSSSLMLDTQADDADDPHTVQQEIPPP